MKTLSLKYGKRLQGHTLIELYEALPADAVADIAASVNEALQTVHTREVPDIPAYMRHLNNAFVEWRYAHEKDSLAEVRMDVMHFLRMLMFLACRMFRNLIRAVTEARKIGDATTVQLRLCLQIPLRGN